jgi:hypothetical protein
MPSSTACHLTSTRCRDSWMRASRRRRRRRRQRRRRRRRTRRRRAGMEDRQRGLPETTALQQLHRQMRNREITHRCRQQPQATSNLGLRQLLIGTHRGLGAGRRRCSRDELRATESNTAPGPVSFVELYRRLLGEWVCGARVRAFAFVSRPSGRRVGAGVSYRRSERRACVALEASRFGAGSWAGWK